MSLSYIFQKILDAPVRRFGFQSNNVWGGLELIFNLDGQIPDEYDKMFIGRSVFSAHAQYSS